MIILSTLLVIVSIIGYYFNIFNGTSYFSYFMTHRLTEPTIPIIDKTTINTSASIKNKTVVEKSITTITEYQEKFFEKEHYKIEACNSTAIGNWENAEITRNKSIIGERKYDIIVLPVQEINPTNDRVGRLLSARLVAHEIEQQTGKEVMSPELALRLLGSNQILFDNKKINELATLVSADIVYLLKRKKVGEQGRLSTEVELSAVLTDNKNNIKKELFLNIGDENIRERKIFSKEYDYKKAITELQDTLEVQIEKVKGNIVETLFNALPQQKLNTHYSQSNPWILPDKISEIPYVAKSPIDNAAYFQLLALLTPEILSYERRRLFERSLLALQGAGKDSTFYNLLHARALFHLYRRPFALPFLEAVTSPEEIAFNEFMNGNLTGLAKIVEKIVDPLLHSIAVIELNSLQYAYQTARQKNESYKVPNNAWLALIISATHDQDIWYAPDNISFFEDLRELYPEFDILFEKTIRGSATINDEYGFEKSVQIMSDLFLLPNGKTSFENDQKYDGMVRSADIWCLYRNLSIANMLRKLKRSATVHCAYDTALETAKSLEGVMSEQPTFMYLYAKALTGKASELKGSENQVYLKRAYGLVEDVFHKTCGVTDHTLASEYLIEGQLKSAIPEEKKHWPVPKIYSRSLDQGCYPTSYLQPSWFCVFLGLPFTNTRIKSLENAAEKLGDDFIDKELALRFNGHPEKASFQAKRFFKKDDIETGIAILRKAITEGDESWDTYSTLAEKIFQKGNYLEAKDILLKFPLFANPQQGNRVSNSYYAYSAGQLFFNIGQYDESKPFFEIAASLNTGAGTQYRAIQNLAIIDGNYQKALQFFYTEAQRYNNSNSYRGYLTYLHLLGMHADSDAAFQVLIKRKGFEQIWASQLVGNRIQNKNIDDIIASFPTDPLRSTEKSILAHHLAANITVDRLPSPDELTVLESVEKGNNIQLNDGWQDVFNSQLTKNIALILPWNELAGNNIKAGSYTSFTDLTIKLKENDYHGCLKKILNFYKENGNSADPMVMFMLPYLTISTSKISSEETIKSLQSQLENLLNDARFATRSFDIYLSEAVIHAYFKRYDDSLKALSKAYLKYYITGEFDIYRPFNRNYQLLQISEWLFNEHGDKRFMEQALDWAKCNQKISPQHAWIYSFEALFGGDENDRVRAAAFAKYLDPNSYWLSKVQNTILKKSSTWWTKNNPFHLKDQERDERGLHKNI